MIKYTIRTQSPMLEEKKKIKKNDNNNKTNLGFTVQQN